MYGVWTIWSLDYLISREKKNEVRQSCIDWQKAPVAQHQLAGGVGNGLYYVLVRSISTMAFFLDIQIMVQPLR